MRWFPALAFSAAGFLAPLLAAQSLQDAQFQLAYSPFGITSLKHVHDRYDTDYIADGHTFGDVLFRYRAAGQKDWKRASAAVLSASAPPNPREVSFTIGELVPTVASLARASASTRGPVFALNDQLLPRNSHDQAVAGFIWFGKKGTTEWVQYDFPEPKELHSVEVYWAVHEDNNNPGKLPKSWRVLYRDGDSWKEVDSPSTYGVSQDQMNEVGFTPVTTSAFRLEVQLQERATAGLFEWGLNGEANRFLLSMIFRRRKTFGSKRTLSCGPFP